MITIPAFDTGIRNQHRDDSPFATIRLGKFVLDEVTAKHTLAALDEPEFLTTLHNTGYVCYAVRNTLLNMRGLSLSEASAAAGAFQKALTSESLGGSCSQSLPGLIVREYWITLNQMELDALRIAWCSHIRNHLKEALCVRVVQQPELQDNNPHQTSEEEQPCQVTLGMLMQNPNTP